MPTTYENPLVGDPVIGLSTVTGVPSVGTGLVGEVYVSPDENIYSIDKFKALIFDSPTPDGTFTASQIAYGGSSNETTVAEFLGHDADSLRGSANKEIGPGGISLSGFIYIPKGNHEITVHSDDGFELRIGGEIFSTYTGTRGSDDTDATAYFDGGLYEIDLLFFDNHGASEVRLEIDGFVVDPSAFYATEDDFLNPPSDVEIIPKKEYHPSQIHTDNLNKDKDTFEGTAERDVMQGDGGGDIMEGRGGDDDIHGGYGQDQIDGGKGDDVLNGGRGSDLVMGGRGNDLIISESDAGEQRIGQLAVGMPTRGDPDGEVNDKRQKLAGWEDQALRSDDILFGGEGMDTFLFTPLLNGKLEILQKHTRSDGSINWAGVAGENDELHDHWTDNFGIDIIGDYVADEDTIAVIGHTATITGLEHRDTDGDGDLESIITVTSNQHGGGGAHAMDLIGQIIVFGDLVYEDDIITDAGVTYGIVEGIDDAYEAISPDGVTKKSVVDGETVFGYDTRDENGNMGPVTGNPEDYVDNRFLEDVDFADPTGPMLQGSRGPFDQLEEVEMNGKTRYRGDGDDTISQSDAEERGGLPGALGFWEIGDPGTLEHEDGTGGNSLHAYTLYQNQALQRDAVVDGPRNGVNALSFNGDDEFAYIQHHGDYQVTQGTIMLWVRPDDLTDDSVFLSKDSSGTDDGGHMYLGHTDDGKLELRFAPGDGGSNTAWVADVGLSEGEWAHVAVNFSADGLEIYVDGEKVKDNSWTKIEGDVDTPGDQGIAYLLTNENPWLLGASNHATGDQDTVFEFGVDDDKLDDAFAGAIADFGIWGGFSEEDVLNKKQIQNVMDNGPGRALTNPSGPEPLYIADDNLYGEDGDDTIYGEGGDDNLYGGAGKDYIEGGYGDDWLEGGAKADVLDGGFGNDVLIGGAGDDILRSRSDVNEDRAGQLVLGEPSRPDNNYEIDPKTLKLYDWGDQALEGDDILIGGAGKDHFQFELLINAKLDIINEHVMDDRSIHWHGVAGENQNVHDHWTDGIGIDIIGDYVAGEDIISVIGHTVNIEVDYHGVDTNDDGIEDDVVSVITAYSQQGAGGGAHDEDYLGYIVVYGDLVDEDDVITDAGAHYGAVDTIDEIQQAVAPNGDKKVTKIDGEKIKGYDSRDVDGDPLGSTPEEYSDNDHIDDIRFASNIPSNIDAAQVILTHAGGTFSGNNTAIEIDHTAEQAQRDGTYALVFNADSPGGTTQTILSKDHAGYKGGGHFEIYIDGGGYLRARFQSFEESTYFWTGHKVEAGVDTHVAFTFDSDELKMYVNGELRDTEEGYAEGMLGNLESTYLGTSTSSRDVDVLNAHDPFYGEIRDVALFDRALVEGEVLLLAGNDGDIDTLIDTTDPLVDPATADDDTIEGSTWDDEIEGLRGHDTLKGKGGRDELYGNGGDDKLIGGGGNDYIEGGRGDDTMTGGGGMDTFAYTGKHGVDTITDFGNGNDKLAFGKKTFDLSNDITDHVVFGTSAQDADDRLIYNKSNGKLWYDLDGKGGDAKELLAILEGSPKLTMSDFELL